MDINEQIERVRALTDEAMRGARTLEALTTWTRQVNTTVAAGLWPEIRNRDPRLVEDVMILSRAYYAMQDR